MNDYLLNLVNKGLSILGGLLTSALLARYLGVELRGEYAFWTQTATVAALFLGLGMNQAFPFFFRQEPGASTFERFSRIFMAQFLVYSIVALVLVTSLDPGLAVTAIVALSIAATLHQQFQSSLAAYRIKLKIHVSIATTLMRVVALVGIFLVAPISILWPVALQIGVWLAVPLICLIVLRVWPFGRIKSRDLRPVLSYSWLPMLSGVLVVLNYNIDTFMLKGLGSAQDLGQYAVAASIVIYFWVIPDAIKEVLISRVVRSDDPRTIIPPLHAALVAALVTVLGFIALGPWVVPLMFGQEFAPAYGLAAILALGVFSMTAYKILGVVMLAEGRRVFYFSSLALSVLLNCGLNLYAIPVYGATGAAWTSVASYTLTGALFLVYFSRLKNIRLLELLTPRPRDLARMMAGLRRGSRTASRSATSTNDVK